MAVRIKIDRVVADGRDHHAISSPADMFRRAIVENPSREQFNTGVPHKLLWSGESQFFK
jgi:hypothetical protein